MRRPLLIILFTACGASTYYARSYFLADQAKTAALQQEADRVQALEQELARERAARLGEADQEKAVIADLQFKIHGEEDALDVARRRVERLKDGVDDKGALSNLQDDLRRERDYVKDLESQIKLVQAEHSRLGTQSHQSEVQGSGDQRLVQQSYSQRIRAGEEALKATQAQLNELKKKRFDPRATSELEGLKDQEKQQKLLVQNLRQEQGEVGLQFVERRELQRRDAAAKLETSRTTEQRLRATYDYERERVRQLERDLGASKQNKGALQAQIKEAQQDLSAHQARLGELRQQLLQHQEKLKAISGQQPQA